MKKSTILFAKRNQIETLIRALYKDTFFTFNFGILPDTPIEELIKRLDKLQESMEDYRILKDCLAELDGGSEEDGII